MKHKLLKFFAGLIFLILMLPLILMQFNVQNIVQPLDGNYEKAAKPHLTSRSWLKGTYQLSMEKYISDHISGRDFLIRFYNSFRFIFFKHVIAEGVTVGKEDVMYQQMYIDAMLGRDIMKYGDMERNAEQLRIVQDSLIKYNKLLVFIIAPGKATMYPEFLPDTVCLQPARPSNYSLFIETAEKAGCKVVDFKKWLMQLKPGLKYPVFPKNGTHWSGHLLPMLMDSLKRYIESNSSFQLPHFTVRQGIETGTNLRYTDNDIGEKLNLLYGPDQWKLAYPVVSFSPAAHRKPDLLSIGDSFNQSFWGFYPFFQELFGENTRYWYYNRLIGWPDDIQKKFIDVKTLDLVSEVMSRDIIFIVSTEQNLKSFSFNFINELYPYVQYGLGHFVSDREEIIRRIEGTPDWLKTIKEKSDNNGIPLDRMVRMDAEWILFNR